MFGTFSMKEIENNLKKKLEIADEKNVPQFEGFPVVEQKPSKQRRQDRQLKEFRLPEKPRQMTSRNLVGVTRPRTEKGRRGGQTSGGTVDRYRHENADGSITWGYTNQDGSFKVIKMQRMHDDTAPLIWSEPWFCFKEETIGTDCVTHGRYGYVDPTGEAREYSYTSGIRCDPNTREVRPEQWVFLSLISVSCWDSFCGCNVSLGPVKGQTVKYAMKLSWEGWDWNIKEDAGVVDLPQIICQ